MRRVLKTFREVERMGSGGSQRRLPISNPSIAATPETDTHRTHVTSRSWTDEQIERLRELVVSGASAYRAAAALGKTVGAVQTRARAMGIPFTTLRDRRKASRE
jgi:hypothetical protein